MHSAVINADGTVWYCRDDRLHRDGDMPALIWDNGTVWYYRDGEPYMPERRAHA